LEGEKARPLLGLKIGDTIDGTAMGLSGQLMLMGGSDRSGFPMMKGVHGAVKTGLLVGKSRRMRRRATVRGEIVSEDIYQLNLVRVVPMGEGDIQGKEGHRDDGGGSRATKEGPEEEVEGKSEEKG